MFKCKYVVWYSENEEIKYMEFEEDNYFLIKEVFEEEEIIKIEVVLL